MCKCIEEVDKQLAAKNTRVQLKEALNMRSGTIREALMVPTEKINSRKRAGPINVFATFCPFCGNRIRPISIEPVEKRS